ncbi:MAG TPA: extracellular solute-binding protein [Chitinophagaceae bacterium]|nr:extracellular solute-binding protein [Chitinophagaceae bacterium]
MCKKSLTGITWDHSRGYTPMIATSQRFSEINPEVTIRWEKRSLQEFADQSIVALAGEYDLIVLDHPWIGAAAERQVILPLDEHLPPAFTRELASYSVGSSYSSYTYQGHQWAFPIDAATPVAACRPDLLSRMNLQPPKTYSQLLAMAATGRVILPAIAIDSLMHFYMFCASLGERPFSTDKAVVTGEIGAESLRLLKRLIEKTDPRCFDWNPVKVYEMMAETDEFVYCPFAYGYSNYSRKGYAAHRLNFHDLISLDNHRKLISTLGGTGIAVSSHTAHPDIAMEYIRYISSATCQQTLYFENGGQPAHYLAWTDYYANFKCAGFFKATLPALKRAYLRPRYNGYIDFQDQAGDIVRDYLLKGGPEKETLHQLNNLYHASVS